LIQPGERRVLRWVALGVMLFLVVVIAIMISRNAGESSAPAAREEPSPAQPSPSPSPTEVELPDIEGIPRRGIAVLVVAEREACWRGFIGGTEISECGLQSIGVTGAPRTVRAGVQLKKEDSSLLELYVVHDGEGVAAAEAQFPRELIEVEADLDR
jgi:hypothetical protein